MSFRLGFIIAFISVIIISYFGTTLWCRFAKKHGFYDIPNERKMHKDPVVTMGGVVIFTVYWASILILTLLFKLIVKEQISLFIASSVIFVTGFLDDRYDLSPLKKSIGILIAAAIVYWTTDFKIYGIFAEFFGEGLIAEWLGFIITACWVYFITNAFNLIDGLDGLSTGVSIIALIALAFISFFFTGRVFWLTTMVLLLVATLIGFLPHNFYPARVFIGDTGALFIGFMVSIFCLMGMQKPGIVSLLTPIVIIAVPLTDAMMAILRRLLKRQAISQADRAHLQHQFMKRGYQHVSAVLAIYVLALACAVLAVLLSVSDTNEDVYILVIIGIIGEFLLVDYLNLLDLDRPLLFKKRENDYDDL